MAEGKPVGITNTVEVLDAAGALSVLIYKAQKGGGAASEIGQRIAAALISNPEVIAKLKLAADGISQVPEEAKDLDLSEVLTLVSKAGEIAAKCAAEIKG